MRNVDPYLDILFEKSRFRNLGAMTTAKNEAFIET